MRAPTLRDRQRELAVQVGRERRRRELLVLLLNMGAVATCTVSSREVAVRLGAHPSDKAAVWSVNARLRHCRELGLVRAPFTPDGECRYALTDRGERLAREKAA